MGLLKVFTFLIFFSLLALVGTGQAKVDLVTLSERDSVQLTIYNSADLTFVRDYRTLTMRQGINLLQFSWANTLIDPTSLALEIPEPGYSLDIVETSYPPRVKDIGIWSIRSEKSGKVPVEITFFTSGLSWKSFYLGTLSPDHTHMDLKGYVRVTNRSGQDYENAQTRLVVGQINLLEDISRLAKRKTPYGKPKTGPSEKPERRTALKAKYERAKRVMDLAMKPAGRKRPKEIKKQGLSEYFLYTIEGTETIKDGWSKRLPSFQAENIPVENVYKYNQKRYGDKVVRFLKFTNDKAHNLGKTPLPGGQIKVFSQINNQEQGLQYIGADESKYIPVDQEIELNLGHSSLVKIEPKIMDYKKSNIVYDHEGNVNGFDQIKDSVIELTNAGPFQVKAIVTRHVDSSHWDLKQNTYSENYKRVDHNTFQYSLELEPNSNATIKYTLIEYQGERAYNH